MAQIDDDFEDAKGMTEKEVHGVPVRDLTPEQQKEVEQALHQAALEVREHLVQKGLPAQPPNGWTCPICQHRKCARVTAGWNQVVGPGSAHDIVYWVCCGCSVHFSNPERFNLEKVR